MSRRERSIPPSGAADGATKGGLPRKTRQPKPASSPRSSPATAAASGEFAVSRSAAVVAGVAVFVVAIVFLVPSERLSQGYDWFQNWRYHKEFLRSTVFGEGSIPLWCRCSFSGKPFLADPETQIFYPGTLLYVLLPASLALPLDVLTHFALAGIGMLLFCRQRGLHPWACLFGAIAYLACGFNLAHTTVGHIFYYAAVAWAPFVFLAVEGWVQTLSPRWIAAGAGALAVQYFAGALQVSWMTMAFGCLYGIGRAVERWWDGRAPAAAGRPGRSGFTLKLAGGLAAIFALGLLLAAAQLMPTLELASLSVREGRGYAYSASPSLPPAQATHMLAPALLKRDVLACEFYGYVGISVLALAGAALGAGMFRRGGAVFLVLGALAALMMLGGATPAFQVFYYTVPGLSLFRDHSREVFILGFCLTGLATAALDRVLVGPARNPRLRLALAGSAVGVCLAAVLMQLSAPSGGGSGPAEVVWLAAAVGSAAAVILQSPQRPWTRWALPGLLLLDLLSAERVVRDRIEIPSRVPDAQEKLASVLRADGSDQGLYRFWFPRGLFMSDQGYSERRSAIEGYENMLLRRYQSYIHGMTGAPVKPDVINILTQSNFTHAPDPFPFKALNVKYAAIPAGGSYKLHVNTDPCGAAFLADRWEVLPEKTILERMRSQEFDPRHVVYLEQRPPDGLSDAAPSADPPGRASVLRNRSNRILVHVEANRPAILVLSEIHYPGWRVRVDGTEQQLLRADYILRAVRVSVGRHEVEFFFSSPSLRWGLLAGGVALGVCAALAFLGRPKGSGQGGPTG